MWEDLSHLSIYVRTYELVEMGADEKRSTWLNGGLILRNKMMSME